MDWGYLGSVAEDGEAHALCGLTMTLGCSRRMMAEAATDQKVGTLLRMHESAFGELGGLAATGAIADREGKFERAPGSNPWAVEPRVIASADFIKRREGARHPQADAPGYPI